MERTPPGEGWIECTGPLVVGDVVRFSESVWRNKKRIGSRVVTAQILDPAVDDVGEQWPKAAAGDGWVYCLTLCAEGDHVGDFGHQFRRQERNVFRNGLVRRPWSDESARMALVEGG